MVVAMIVIVGITRLTGSSVSIVEWCPVTGILSPFSFESWQVEFAKYKAFPKYNSVNYRITLSQFKFIYLLEFIHRLLGRITALIYIVPLIYFYFKGTIKNHDILTYISALLLFCLQGFMWRYVIKSSLLNSQSVGRFRLAFHLVIAIIIYHLLFYKLLIFSFVAIIVIYVQIFLRALVVGPDAGRIYSSFQLMGDSFIPMERKDNFFDIKNWPFFIQFIHRLGRYNIFLVVAVFAICVLKIAHPKLNKIAYFLMIALWMQLSTGITTLIYSVPYNRCLYTSAFCDNPFINNNLVFFVNKKLLTY